MATLSAVFGGLFDASGAREEVPRAADHSTRVPGFANEDIYFFIKRIDNSRVVREADPAARGACWKTIGTVVAGAVLLVSVLLPSAYSLLAGYRIQALKQEEERLMSQQASLELDEARLVSPARMAELARIQQFIDPAPQKVVYLDNQGSLAMNRK